MAPSTLRRLLALLLLLGCVPLRAQLDPRLQASPTDFLDLYQKSSGLKPKPEIASIFDFSGSMASLMFHPLYRNNDATDADDYRNMTFSLTNATSGAAPVNTYNIRAYADTCGSAVADFTVTVTSTGATGTASATSVGCGAVAPSQTIYAYPSAIGTNAYASIQYSSTNGGATYTLKSNSNTGTVSGYTMTHANGNTAPSPTIEVTPQKASYSAGETVTLTVWLSHNYKDGDPSSSKDIGWTKSCSGACGTYGTATWTEEVTNKRYKSVVPFTFPAIPVFNPVQLNPITLIGPPSPFLSGSILRLKTTYLTQGNSTRINWYVWNSAGNLCAPLVNPVPSQTTAAGEEVNWTVPAYCSTSGAGTPAYVTASLNASKGAGFDSGLAYPGWISGSLVKPDGTLVADTDAQNASAGSGLVGASGGKLHILNWLRAASHARFVSGSRTIDIPLPWKLVDPASTTNPLASLTVYDHQAKPGVDASGNATTLNYGSGYNLEMDTCYKLNVAEGVFTYAGNGAFPNYNVNSATLSSVSFRPGYISWLFNGKYQNSDPAKPGYINSATSSLLGKHIVFDAANASLAAGQGSVGWGKAFGPTGTWGDITVPRYNADGTYRDLASAEASGYRIPALTRAQAVKQAAIRTWIAHQADVYWAFRCLDPDGEAGNASATTIDNNSRTNLSASNPTTTRVAGNDSGWTVLNNTSSQGIGSTSGNSVTGMARIAALFTNGSTSLTYAMARALAQYGDPSSVFNDVMTDADVSQCVNHYLLLFTDGLDNNGSMTANPNAATPYLTGSGSGQALDAGAGNRAIITAPGLINRSGANWNMFTLAAIGAHLSDPYFGTAGTDYLTQSLLASGTSGTPSTFLPLSIVKRKNTTYDQVHRVTTMTIGVSLGGQTTDAASPKRSLFLAAALGDPSTRSGLLSGFHAFSGWDQTVLPVDASNDWIQDPLDPANYPAVGKRREGAVYFFDATDTTKLSSAIDYAFRIAIGAGGSNTTASPNLPFIGATFGKQIYIAKFSPPATGGVVWPGNLMMFGTRESNGTVAIVDQTGNATTTLDKTTAQWSADDALAARPWSGRKLYTRLPGNATTPERGLHAFTDTGTAYSNPDATDNSAGLKNYVATLNLAAGSAAQVAVIQRAAGAETTSTPGSDGRPSANRATIMGDIIDSAPAALEYTFGDSVISTGLAATTVLATANGNRFRLLLAGTNQGWLHGFGEVTRFATVTDASGTAQEIVQGKVEELWAFMPTDFLSRLDSVYGASLGNTHRFMVDGSPAIYFLDLPGNAGKGLMDASTSAHERALAIVGLGKGGRSYYAINLRDPFNPSLQWSLVPDEAAVFPASRNLTRLSLDALRAIIGGMGFSTCTPGIGRMAFTAPNGTRGLRDVVFLGGGFSTPQVDALFTDGDGKTVPLGRCVIALDAYTGEVLAAVDLKGIAGVSTTLGSGTGGNPASTTTIGPVSAGIVPFEFILNSGLAQRAYFADFKGGLWAWGSRAVADASVTGYEGYRLEQSDLAKWTADGTPSGGAGIRKVFQDGSGTSALYTTLPAPFRVGSFPGKGKTTGAAAPTAAGIALVSGNRYNPLDYLYATGAAPSQHRLTVVFDRQDSRLWGLDSASGPDAAIQDAALMAVPSAGVSSDPAAAAACSTAPWKEITPGCDDFYLAPKVPDNTKHGYFVNFESAVSPFVTKGVNTPMVVANTLFYTYFMPTKANPCSGGTGTSYSQAIANALRPLAKDTRSTIANASGNRLQWAGIASDYLAFGTRGAVQGGMVAPAGSSGTPSMSLKTLSGTPGERFPKARVWRTVR